MRLPSSSLVVLFAGILASACDNRAGTSELGRADVSISAMTDSGSITAIRIEAQPANVLRDLTYDSARRPSRAR